jgi:hypothetical protein
MLSELRGQREATSSKLQGVEVTLIRSCNDQGHLYASITQQDVAAALVELGHIVKPRDVRINQVMKRIDNYDVHIKLDSDLDAVIKLHVQADRKLDLDKHEEAAPAPEAAEGQSAQAGADKGGDRKAARGERGGKARRSEDAPKPAEKAEPVKGSFTAKAAPKAEAADKSPKADKADKPAKGEKPAKAEKAGKGAKKG